MQLGQWVKWTLSRSFSLELFLINELCFIHAEEYVPGAARKGMEWQYFVGNCSDPAVQESAKVQFQTGLNSVFGDAPDWCQSQKICSLDNIKITCGKTQTNRKRRSVPQVGRSLMIMVKFCCRQ